MTSPPRVLHVIDSLRLGGAEALLAALLGELSRTGRSWNAVCVPATGDADPELVARVRERADAFAWLPDEPLYRPRLYRALGRVMVDQGIEVVHSHLSTANIVSRGVALPLRKRHLSTIHTLPGPGAEDSRLRAAVDGWSSWLSRRLVAPSEEVAAAYRARFRLPTSRFRVIPNAPAAEPAGEDFDRDEVRRALGAGGDDRLVLVVARLQPEKGIDDLLAAATLLRERQPTLRIAVAGSGPEEEGLRARIERAGLDGSFTLLGSRSDVGSLLAAADAFCLPSRHEGLPLSLLEAMRAGLPCVATRVGGVPGVVTDRVSGLLVEPASPGALAAALEAVFADPAAARAIGEGARAVVRERFEMTAVASAYADIYDELAGRGPPAGEVARA